MEGRISYVDWRRGLEGYCSFGELHPLVNAAYYVMVLAIIMVAGSPVYLVMAVVTGFIYGVMQKGTKSIPATLGLLLIIALLATLFNGIFTHNGETVLFYIGANRITAEAFFFGGIMSMMLMAILLWLGSFTRIMTSDKIIYLFSRIAPVLGLTISMIFRFIPLLKNRFQEIRAGAKALGRDKQSGLINKGRESTKEASTLISWSLEASIDSADSMSARGYGLKGRTSFHLFRFHGRDGILLALILLLGGTVLAGYAMDLGKMYYYPVARWAIGEAVSPSILAVYGAYLVLLLLPIVMDLYGEKKW